MEIDSLKWYELLTLATSLVAVVISAVALIRGHRLAQRQTELQAKQADLAAFQHKLLVREQQQLARADIRAVFIKIGTSYKLVIENSGPATARNVRVADLAGNPAPEPLIASQVASTFPLPDLRSGETCSLIAAIHNGIALPVPLVFTWDDDSGNDQQREIRVSIS